MDIIVVAVAVAGGSTLALTRKHRKQSMRREIDGNLLPLHHHFGMDGEQDLALRSVALLMPTPRQLPCGLEHPSLLRSLRRQHPGRSHRAQQFRPISIGTSLKIISLPEQNPIGERDPTLHRDTHGKDLYGSFAEEALRRDELPSLLDGRQLETRLTDLHRQVR
ncbi:hypothetical protein GXW78_00005, partial [Roseomonas terrae]